MEPFQRKFWSALQTLTWIMTRDRETTNSAAAPDRSDIFLAVEQAYDEILRPDQPSRFAMGEEEAWENELVPAMVGGEISAIGRRERGFAVPKSGIFESVPGDEFPPKNNMGLAIYYFVEWSGSKHEVLVPRGKFQWRTWLEWHEPKFKRDDVLRLWPEKDVDEATDIEPPTLSHSDKPSKRAGRPRATGTDRQRMEVQARAVLNGCISVLRSPPTGLRKKGGGTPKSALADEVLKLPDIANLKNDDGSPIRKSLVLRIINGKTGVFSDRPPATPHDIKEKWERVQSLSNPNN